MVAEVRISRCWWPLSWFDGWRQVPAYGRSRAKVLDAARRYARTLGEEVSIVSARAPGRGRFLLYGGHALAWAGFALAVWGATSITEIDLKHVVFGPMGAGMLLPLLGGPLIRRGRRLLQPTAAELQAVDKRRPILLLRSFRDDDAEIVASVDAKGDLELNGLEETLGPPFSSYGPFIAIAKPGEQAVRLGAAREQFGESDWKSAVERWMDQAVLLLVVPGTTAGLSWELDAIARRRHAHKTLVMMPPPDGYWPWQGKAGSSMDLTPDFVKLAGSFEWKPKSNWSYEWDRKVGRLRSTRAMADEREAARQQRWSNVRAAFKGVPGFAELPAIAPERLIAVHVSTSGEPILITGPKVPRASDYARAVAFAVYGMKCHGKW